MAKKSEVMYITQRDWKASPEVWKSFARFGVWCVVAGFILAVWAGCSDVTKDAKGNVPCKATVSVPAQKK